MLALAALGFWCERFQWGKKYSGVMALTIVSMTLSNIGIIPSSAPVYDVAWDYLVPIAIPLLLLEADLKRMVRESGAILLAFTIGSAAVVAGALVAVHMVNLEPVEAELAGMFAGTFIGGSLNFVSVAEATSMHDGSIIAASVAVDNVITNVHFLLLLLIPGFSWLSRMFPSERSNGTQQSPTRNQNDLHRIADINIPGLLMSLSLAFLLAALGGYLAEFAGTPQFAIFVTTALTLMIATFAPRQVEKLSGNSEAGTVLMFIFLACAGATADLWNLVDLGPVLLAFSAIIIAIHLLILFPLGKLFKMSLAELVMASAVTIGGPSSAAALVSAKGWRDLLIPGVFAGSLGYAIGSVGMIVVELLR
jgi:uncharacterized membrane protein